MTQAARHSLIVGTFSTNFLYTVGYDDETGDLDLVAKNAVPAASSWIALNNDASRLYGTDWNAEEPSFVNYDISDPSNIKHEATIVGGRGCAGSKSIFVSARYTSPTVMSVYDNGTLKEIIQDYEYVPGTAVHGTAFSPGEKYLFSADTTGNTIWTHSIDDITGKISFVNKIPGPSEGSHPRHLVVHDLGKYMYAVLEGSSQLAQYEINGSAGTMSFHDVIYPLIREGEDASEFWADEVSISANNKYLWATNRAYNDNRKGYISVFELEESGAIVDQLHLLPTTTSGGFANSVATSRFDDSIAALTDNSTGFVQIWHVERGLVAHLDIEDGGGCCANAVWLD
ncbi:Lactonase, 7-bladed beta-propeller-domain-containing protein [Biscogniauxia marginata]|nr:Lactonase, 7-bladed beta-propeller-domain-containing protein [Biscogniauxia marginata]